jgi:hypothetical protein
VAALGCLAAVAYRYALPEIVEWKLRRELVKHGFANARFELASVGFDHVRLTGVTLGPGLELGEVELDAGVSMLWSTADRVTLRRARIAREALAGGHGNGNARSLPVRSVRLEASVLTVGDTEIAVDGTIALDTTTPSGDLVAKIAAWQVGSLALRDVVVRVRDGRACASARAETTDLEACAPLSTWLPDELAVTWLARDRSGWIADGRARIEWSSGSVRDGHVYAAIPRWSTEQGKQRLTIRNATLSAEFSGSLASLEATGDLRIAQVEMREGAEDMALLEVELPAAIHARSTASGWQLVTGALDGRASVVTANIGGRRLHAVRTSASSRPIALGVETRWPSMLQWSAADLRYGGARFVAPSGTVSAERVVQWRAAEARWGAVQATRPSGTVLANRDVSWEAPRARWQDVQVNAPVGTIDPRSCKLRWHAVAATRDGTELRDPAGTVALDRNEQTLMWSTATLGLLELGRGEIDLRVKAGRLLISRGSVRAYGGMLSLAKPGWGPIDEPIDVHARGLQLEQALRAIGPRVDGRGVLDGELAVRATDQGWELQRASLHGRGRGAIRVSDARLRERVAKSAAASQFALHERIAGSLIDFEYAQLGIVLGPRGADPELRVSTRGRGKRVPQELDLVINVRGVRDTTRRLSRAGR